MTENATSNAGALLGFPLLRHHQIAYVTTNLDEALRRIDGAFGLERYYFINTRETPSHPNQAALRIALVRAAGTEFEIIEPLGSNDAVWSDPLPKDGSFALLFHHIGLTVRGSMQDFENYRAAWDAERHPIVVDGAAGDDARWFYTDERQTLGHFVEHCWFSERLTAHMNSVVPRLS